MVARGDYIQLAALHVTAYLAGGNVPHTLPAATAMAARRGTKRQKTQGKKNNSICCAGCCGVGYGRGQRAAEVARLCAFEESDRALCQPASLKEVKEIRSIANPAAT